GTRALISAITQFALTGMTAQAASASTQVTRGASKNTPLLAPAGITGSLTTNFSKSAKDCSKPQGPTTFGPRLICTAAQILRSARSMQATATSRITSNSADCATMTMSGQRYIQKKPISYSAAVLAAAWARAEHSAMIAEARAMGLVK